MVRFLIIPLVVACTPGEAVSKYELLDDAVAPDTATPEESEPGSEPSGEPSGEPSSEPSGEPSSEPSGEPSSEPSGEPSGEPSEDSDGDGFTVEDGDCDDNDASINPDAEDIMDDGIDQDCSGGDRSCANPTTVTWNVSFPATAGCDWGINDNFPATNGILSARTEQEEVYTPPSGATMCEVRPSIQDNQGGYEQTGFEYDDDLLLTYNDYVMFTTTDSFVFVLPNGSWGGKLYDWFFIRGNAAFNGSLWEWGNTEFIDDSGFELYTANGKTNNLNNLSVTEQRMSFMLVVMGDNDNPGDGDGPDDCYHTGLSFPVEIDLAQ